MSKKLEKKINKATAWSSFTELLSKIVAPIVNIILARLLNPAAFGLVATITVVTSFADVFVDAGFQKYIIQREFNSEKELDDSTNVAFWSNLFLSITAFLIIVFFRNQIADLVGSSGLGTAISIASISIIFTAFSSIQMARYKRDFDFKTLFYVRLGAALIPLIITVPLAFVLKNHWALVFGTLAVNLFTAIVLTIKSKWKPKLSYSIKLLKEMFSFSMWTLLESISIWLTTYIGTFIVGVYLSDYYLGLYKTSMSTVNSYMAIITSAIMPVFFSALSRYQNDEQMFKKTYFKFQSITSVLIAPMGVGIFVFSDLVTKILLGSKWLEASGFIGIFGLCRSLYIVLGLSNSEVYRAKGKPKISLLAQILTLAVLIPSLVISASYGFKPLYFVRSLSNVAQILFGFILMQIFFDMKWYKIITNIIPMLVSASIMGIVGFGLKQLSDSMIWHFAVIAICVIVYFSLLLGLFASVRKEVLSIPIVQKYLKKIKGQGR